MQQRHALHAAKNPRVVQNVGLGPRRPGFKTLPHMALGECLFLSPAEFIQHPPTCATLSSLEERRGAKLTDNQTSLSIKTRRQR